MILNSIYEEIFPERTVMRIEYLHNDMEFQKGGRDLRVVLRKPGNDLFNTQIFETVEEKIRTPEKSGYKDILIEYLSNKRYGTLGWIYTSEADWLSYVKQPNGSIEVLLLPMQDLKRWFVLNKDRYTDRTSSTAVGENLYETVNKAIPYDDPYFKKFYSAHGVKSIKKSLGAQL